MSGLEALFLYTFVILPVGFGLFCAALYTISWAASAWTWLFHRNEEPKPKKYCRRCAEDNNCAFHWVLWGFSPGHKDTPLVARVVGNAVTLPFALVWLATLAPLFVLVPLSLVALAVGLPALILYTIVVAPIAPTWPIILVLAVWAAIGAVALISN